MNYCIATLYLTCCSGSSPSQDDTDSPGSTTAIIPPYTTVHVVKTDDHNVITVCVCVCVYTFMYVCVFYV